MIDWKKSAEIPRRLKDGEVFTFMGKQFKVPLCLILTTTAVIGYYDYGDKLWRNSNGDQLSPVTHWVELNSPVDYLTPIPVCIEIEKNNHIPDNIKNEVINLIYKNYKLTTNND